MSSGEYVQEHMRNTKLSPLWIKTFQLMQGAVKSCMRVSATWLLASCDQNTAICRDTQW